MPNGGTGGLAGGRGPSGGAGARGGNGGGGGGGCGGRAGPMRAGGGGAASPPWDCGICGRTNNWGSRLRCRECEAHRPGQPPSAGQRGGGANRGAAGGGGRPTNSNAAAGGGGNRGAGVGSAASPLGTFAQRQIQRQQQDAERRAQAERRKAQDLQAEVRRLQRELSMQARTADADNADDDDADEMDTADNDYANWAEEDRQARVDIIKGGLQYLESRFGAESEELAQAKSEIEAIQRASREAKPFRTHRAQLERRKNRLESQQERDSDEADRLQAEIEAAKEKLTKLQSTMEERNKEIDKVDVELKELLRRALAEDAETAAATDTVPPAPAPKAEAWKVVEATLADMATNAGLPPEQSQQMETFLSLFRQVATNVLAAPGGATLAAPPSCGPRWANTASRKATAAAAATTGTSGGKGASTEGSGSGDGVAAGTSGSGQPAQAPVCPPTPQTQLPAKPPQGHPSDSMQAGTGAASSGGGLASGLCAIPSVLSPHQATATDGKGRTGTAKGTAEGAEATGRRQRSASCSRETRKAEAARAAAAAQNDAGRAQENLGTAGGGSGTTVGADTDGGQAQARGDADTQAADGNAQVHIGTDQSDDGGMDSDLELWTDADADGAVDVVMGRRDGETEADRRKRISTYLRDRLDAKNKARRARKEANRAAGGVRRAHKNA